MARKDHLITVQEELKSSKQSFKRNSAILFQAIQPTVANQINGIGATSKTPDEVRDTKFPVLNPIEAIGKNISNALNIDLALENSPFHCLELSDVGATVTDLAIDFINLVKNKAETFFLDITKDPGNVADPTITFDPPVSNLPSGFPGQESRYLLEIIARETPTEIRFEVVNNAGNLSFPIIPPVDVRGNVSTAQDIDLTLTTAHSTTMTLTGDISITFSNLPATANQIEWEIEIKQDATGGHDVTSWPAAVTPIPVINQTALATTLVVLRTNDNGTTIFTLLATSGVFSPVSLWANFAAVTDVNFATFDGINIDRLRFVVDSGVPVSSADPSIFLDASGDMIQNVAALDSIVWKANNVEMAKIIEVTAGVYRLDLLDHSIDNAQDIRFDDTSGATVFAGTDPAIGYDSVASSLIINYPTGAKIVVSQNNVIGSTEITDDSIDTNLLTVDVSLLVGVTASPPVISGEFRNDGTDTFVFSGGAIRNMSNIGSDPTAIVDGNTTATVLDSAPSFSVVLNGVQKFTIADTRVDYEELDLFGVTSITMHDSGATAISTLTASAAGLVLNLIDTTDVYDINFNSVIGFSVDEVKTQIYSTTANTIEAILSLFRDDASPTVDDKIGEIQFRGRDLDAANVAYGKMHVETEIVIAATAQASFHWILRNNGGDTDQMNLKNGVLGVSIHQPTAANAGGSLVLNRIDTGSAIGDTAGRIAFNITDPTEVNYGRLSVIWDDTSVGDDSSRMDFEVLTDDILRNIFTLRGSPITDNKISIEIGADSLIFAKTGVIGYFVTSDPTITSSIGDNGTIQIPQFSNGTPTLAQLNAAFGAFDGAIGQDTSDGKLYVRKSSTVWSFYSESGTVV